VRALIQRVASASVSVEGETLSRDRAGAADLVCAMQGDSAAEADRLATRIPKLRIFKDAAGKMNRSLLDSGGAALVVSQFTLAADTSRGNRPGFSAAAPPQEGAALYERFARALEDQGIPTGRGRFGADMQVSLINDGPVTIWMDTAD
jgi:D-tyrosyl-tRNA(Tyr) deacylase